MLDNLKRYCEQALSPYKRESTLPVTDLKILLMILAPRNISFINHEISKIDFIDKVWFKYFGGEEAFCKLPYEFYEEHPKYTHIALISDDAVLDVKSILNLMAVLRKWDVPVLSGCCNMCNHYENENYTCSYCSERRPHDLVNASFDPVLKRPNGDVYFSNYNFVTRDWQKNHPVIKPVTFQGFAPLIVPIDTFLEVPLRSLSDQTGLMVDLAFARDCEKKEITQFVDFRTYLRHWGLFHRQIKFNPKTRKYLFDKPSEIVFEEAKRRLV